MPQQSKEGRQGKPGNKWVKVKARLECAIIPWAKLHTDKAETQQASSPLQNHVTNSTHSILKSSRQAHRRCIAVVKVAHGLGPAMQR